LKFAILYVKRCASSGSVHQVGIYVRQGLAPSTVHRPPTTTHFHLAGDISLGTDAIDRPHLDQAPRKTFTSLARFICKPYQYTSLSDNRFIRIVTLLPGNPYSPIKCNIEEEKLDNILTPYWALSYVCMWESGFSSIYSGQWSLFPRRKEPAYCSFAPSRRL
jgi:hypothetical protein